MGLSWLLAFFRPLKRSPSRQQQVDEACHKLALYHYPTCSYCLRVRQAIWRLNLPIELRNAANHEPWGRELYEQGGKQQVPCLQIRHSDRTEWLYESEDIISYLKVRFSR